MIDLVCWWEIKIERKPMILCARNRPLSWYSCSAKVWSNTCIKHTTGKNKPSLVSAPIFRVTDQSTVKCHRFENCIFFIRICMLNGQVLPVQLICHTKPYNNLIFQIDGSSRYFSVWVWQLVHLLILVCSFHWCVLASLYNSCPIRDKGLYVEIKWTVGMKCRSRREITRQVW